MYIHNDYLFIMFILLLRVSFFPTILVPFNASCFNDKNNPNMKLQVAQVCTSPTFQFPQPETSTSSGTLTTQPQSLIEVFPSTNSQRPQEKQHFLSNQTTEGHSGC